MTPRPLILTLCLQLATTAVVAQPRTDAQSGAPSVQATYERARACIRKVLTTHREDRFGSLVERVARSQKILAEKQGLLLLYAQRTGGSVRTETFLHERLIDLTRAQAENAMLYQEMREAAAYLKKSGSDLSSTQERVAQVESRQREIEADWERLASSFGTAWASVPPIEDERLTPSVPGGSEPVAKPSVAEAVPAPAPSPSVPAPVAEPVASSSTVTVENQMQSMPMEAGDSEASYKSRLGELQAIFLSDSSTSEEKQAAYRQFIQIKGDREKKLRAARTRLLGK